MSEGEFVSREPESEDRAAITEQYRAAISRLKAQLDAACACEPDYPEDDGSEPYQFVRTCGLCGATWGSNHCPHDGVQCGCPDCGWIEAGKVTPLQVLGFTAPPPQT